MLLAGDGKGNLGKALAKGHLLHLIPKVLVDGDAEDLGDLGLQCPDEVRIILIPLVMNVNCDSRLVPVGADADIDIPDWEKPEKDFDHIGQRPDHFVDQGIEERALLYLDDLIRSFSEESQSNAVALVDLEAHAVTVLVRGGRGYDGEAVRLLEFTDLDKGILEDSLFRLALAAIGKVLPVTPAARTEVFAGGDFPVF